MQIREMIYKQKQGTTTEYTLMHNKYIITYECHDNVKSGTINYRNILTSPCTLTTSPCCLTSLLSAPEREVTSPSDFKVVGALRCK